MISLEYYSPNTQHLGAVARGAGLGVYDERPDVGDRADCGGHEPGETGHRAHGDQHGQHG